MRGGGGGEWRRRDVNCKYWQFLMLFDFSVDLLEPTKPEGRSRLPLSPYASCGLPSSPVVSCPLLSSLEAFTSAFRFYRWKLKQTDV